MADIHRAEQDQPLNLDEQLALFSASLARLAQRHLDGRLKRRLDGEDVVQSAFRTFLRRNALGEFQIEGAAQLWKLLVHITVMKARAKGRFHTADRRNIQHEVPDGEEWLSQIAFGEPQESEALALVETVEFLLRDVPDWYAVVLEMRLNDHSATDIALELKLSRQSVHRALRVLRDRLEQELATNS